MACGQKLFNNQETIIFKENPKQNALEYLAFGKGFFGGSPYRLDILTIILKKIFNQISKH